MEKIVERFRLQLEDGQIVGIIVYQKFLDSDSFEGQGAIPGLKRMVDSWGRPVQPVDGSNSEYTIQDDLGRLIKARRI